MNNYLIPANSKKSMLIFGLFNTTDLIIFLSGLGLTLLLMLAATVLLIFLSQEIKKSYIGAITLFAYLVILIIHVAKIATLQEEFRYLLKTLSRCIVIDFIFIFITF